MNDMNGLQAVLLTIAFLTCVGIWFVVAGYSGNLTGGVVALLISVVLFKILKWTILLGKTE